MSNDDSDKFLFDPAAIRKEKVDAATLASTLQLQEQHRELIYSFIALAKLTSLRFSGGSKIVSTTIVFI